MSVDARSHIRNEWGVTLEAPDGCRPVLCRRGWSNR